MKTTIIILAVFTSTLLASTTLDGEPELSTELLYGEDCTDAHGGFFLDIMASYEVNLDNNTEGVFTIKYYPTSPDMIFNTNVSIFSLPEGSKIINGTIDRSIQDFTSYREVSWNVSGNLAENDIIQANITLSVLVPHNYPIHPNYLAFYSITLTYSLTPEDTSLLNYLFSLRWLDIDFTNRVIGYIAYTLLVVTSVIGMPGIPRIIKSKSDGRISATKIRQIHRYLGYVVFLIVAFHVIVSMLAPMWLNIIKLWILPTFYVPEDLLAAINLTDAKLGIELGRWAGLLILLTVAGGIDFSRLSRDWGRKFALLLQQMSYVSLVAIALHTIMIGSFAREQPLFVVYTWFSLLVTFSIRFMLLFKQSQKKSVKRKERNHIEAV